MTRFDDIQAKREASKQIVGKKPGRHYARPTITLADVDWLLDRVTQLETALEKEERLCAIYDLAGSGEARDVLRAALDTEQT